MFSQAKEILKHRGQGYFVFHGHRLHAPINHSSSMLLSHKTQIIVFTYTCCKEIKFFKTLGAYAKGRYPL